MENRKTMKTSAPECSDECIRVVVRSLLQQLCPISSDRKLQRRREALEDILLLQVSVLVSRSPGKVIFLQKLWTAGLLSQCDLDRTAVAPVLLELWEDLTLDGDLRVADLESSPVLQQRLASAVANRLLPDVQPSVCPTVGFRPAVLAQAQELSDTREAEEPTPASAPECSDECIRVVVRSLLQQLCPISSDRKLQRRREALEDILLLQVSVLVSRSPGKVIFLQKLWTAGLLSQCDLDHTAVAPVLLELREDLTLDGDLRVADLESSPVLQQRLASAVANRLLPDAHPSICPTVGFRPAVIAQAQELSDTREAEEPTPATRPTQPGAAGQARGEPAHLPAGTAEGGGKTKRTKRRRIRRY